MLTASIRPRQKWRRKSRCAYSYLWCSGYRMDAIRCCFWGLEILENLRCSRLVAQFRSRPSFVSSERCTPFAQQMRLIHKIPFAPHEVESYRQLVFENLTRGLKYLLDSMEDMDLKVSEANFPYIELIENASDLRDGEPFPMTYYEPLKSLWADPGVQKAWERGNEAALPEKYLPPSFSPTFLT
jgi:hypothetical protein